ncbi:lipocalin family protein [Flavobacterium sp.]|uniref:lipocalin family protein n=1 Tax=Flavobacterium sp. TaxID=239 RepID=UPI00374FDBE9
MKKTFFLLLIAIFIFGCKSKSATNTKLNNKAEVALKGNWTISSVTYPGSDYIKVTSFDVADSKCFVGSQWKFISNNNKGDMSLNNSGCAAFSSPITWFINKEGQYVMKIINETKSKKVLEGYVLKLANVSDNSFQLVDNANVGGKNIEVIYQFSRN